MKLFQVTIQGAIMLVRAESPESADRLARRRRRQQLAASDKPDEQQLAARIGNDGPIVFTAARAAQATRIGTPAGKESAVFELSSDGAEEIVSVIVPRG